MPEVFSGEDFGDGFFSDFDVDEFGDEADPLSETVAANFEEYGRSDFSFPAQEFLTAGLDIGSKVLPIWFNSLAANQKTNPLQQPLYNQYAPGAKVATAQKAGYLTGTTIGDGLIIGGLVLVALFVAMKK